MWFLFPTPIKLGCALFTAQCKTLACVSSGKASRKWNQHHQIHHRERLLMKEIFYKPFKILLNLIQLVFKLEKNWRISLFYCLLKWLEFRDDAENQSTIKWKRGNSQPTNADERWKTVEMQTMKIKRFYEHFYVRNFNRSLFFALHSVAFLLMGFTFVAHIFRLHHFCHDIAK